MRVAFLYSRSFFVGVFKSFKVFQSPKLKVVSRIRQKQNLIASLSEIAVIIQVVITADRTFSIKVCFSAAEKKI